MSNIHAIWKLHQNSKWPDIEGPSVGQLMTLDTVIGGAVVYYLEHREGLDAQRKEIVQDCLLELADLLEPLPEEHRTYFERLNTLGSLLLSPS